MANNTKRASRTRAPTSPQSRIPEALHEIESTTTRRRGSTIAVPTLVLRGEWLKAVGFPIGSAAVLTTDRRGEMTLHRLGLGFPRRLRVTATRSK